MQLVFASLLISLFFAGLLAAQAGPYSAEHQLDLNNATFEQIQDLPIPQVIAQRIYDHITYQGPFENVYQLKEVQGMTQELFLKIKPLVKIVPFAPKTEREQRIEDMYYKLDRWEGNEGINQSLVDLWIEHAMEPVDINTIRYSQLENLQGVSPVDAAAIINYRNQVGKIYSTRDLRSAPYLSYYGYRNASDFISFEPAAGRKEFHGHFMVQMDNTPFLAEEADASSQVPVETLGEQLNNNYPSVYTRFFGTLGPNIRFGYSYYHSLYEPVLQQNLGFVNIPKGKAYLGIENQKLGPVELRKLYIGNYSLAFGQGVVMENTDYFTPRKSGFGFRKRFIGLSGDNSRTREYKLTGAAAEFGFKNAQLFLFGSYDKRDAILNTTPVTLNGQSYFPVNQFIVLDQRFEYAPTDNLRQNLELPWRDSVNELLYGTHVAYNFQPATQLGITYYESAYDRLLRPDIQQIVDPGNYNQFSLADNEIYNSYGGTVSDGENPLWNNALSFRRVYGMDFQSVHENVAVQGEYAELDKSKGMLKNPHAFVGSVYVQYSSLSLLGLYRDYSLEFDNPYQRSFSNYQRFKRTIYQDYFYLQDPQYGQLYTNNPQPQPEKGFYFNTRYQMNRNFVLSLEYDKWRRVSDDATQQRVVGTLDYRPIFPLRINLRQKYQGREVQNNLTTEYFENLEFRGMLRMRLSSYDELGALYVSSITKFRPRPRLSYPVETGADFATTNRAGNIASPAEALGGFFTHNFNEWLKIKGFLGYYKGFFWNFEDTQFQVMSSINGAMRYWFSVYTRISPQVSMRLKYTRDYQSAISYIQARDSNNEPIPSGDKMYEARLYQPTESFYYLEFNYHF